MKAEPVVFGAAHFEGLPQLFSALRVLGQVLLPRVDAFLAAAALSSSPFLFLVDLFPLVFAHVAGFDAPRLEVLAVLVVQLQMLSERPAGVPVRAKVKDAGAGPRVQPRRIAV
jgi:hypothetical protein